MTYLFLQSKVVQFNKPKINIIEAKEIQKKEHSIWIEDIDGVVLVAVVVLVLVLVVVDVEVEVGVVVGAFSLSLIHS